MNIYRLHPHDFLPPFFEAPFFGPRFGSPGEHVVELAVRI